MFGGELLHLPGARLSSQREARQELAFTQSWSFQQPGIPGQGHGEPQCLWGGGEYTGRTVLSWSPGGHEQLRAQVSPNRIVSSLSAGMWLGKLTHLYIQKSPKHPVCASQSTPTSHQALKPGFQLLRLEPAAQSTSGGAMSH